MADPAGHPYGGVAIGFHWLVALLVLSMIPFGFVMANMDLSPQKLEFYSWHKSFGIVVLTLAALRLVWRLFNPPPPLPADVPGWQKFASQVVHYGLYAALFAMPLSGWLMSSAAGFTVSPFKLFDLPNLVAKDEALFKLFRQAHELIAFAIIGLLALHVGAALYHHVVRRDGVLARMLPFLAPRS